MLILATIIYSNRERIINRTLAVLVEPFRVSVDEVELMDFGRVHLKGLRLSPRDLESDLEMVEIPEAQLTYNFDELRRNRTVKSIELFSPTVRIGKSSTAAFPERNPSDPSPAPVDLSAFAIFTESLQVEDGKLEVDLDGAPPISGYWKLETGPLQFDESGRPAESISIELQKMAIGPDGKNGKIESASATVLAYKDLSRIVIDTLEISGIETEITPDWFGDETAKGAEQPSGMETVTPSAVTYPELLFGTIRIGRSSVAATGFDGTNNLPSFPDLAFDTEIEFHNVSYRDGRWRSPEPLSVAFTDVAVGPASEQLASADQIAVRLNSPGELIHDQTVSAIEITGLDVLLTDQTLRRFRSDTTSATENSESDSDSTKTAWTVGSLQIDDGTFVMRDATFGDSRAPRIETALTAELSDLKIGGATGFFSDSEQKIILEKASLYAPGAEPAAGPLLSFGYAELGGKWSEFDFDGRIERFILKGPRIQFTDEALGDWSHPTSDTTSPRPVNRPIYRIADLEVTGGKLEADSQFAEGRVPKIASDFSISTDVSEDSEPFSYRIGLQNFELRNHSVSIEFEGPPAPPTLFPEETAPPVASPVAEEQVLTIHEILVAATAEELQRTRRVGAVTIDGAVLRVGNGLRTVVDATQDTEEKGKDEPVDPSPDEAERPEPRQAASGEIPTWLLEKVQITRSEVRFEALIPQVEGLEFNVETILTDVPLSPDKLLASDKKQKVELAGIEIKDPYDSFITVAELPTIFVQFSLAGLANQEVEQIDLIGPSLYVGQGLFWWIDYQRNFRAQNEGATVALEGGPVDEGVAGEPDWVIKTINATSGKIVIAPTGVPIGVVPFPFNATTTMQDGKTELKLNIPNEDYVYRFPDYKVDLYGLTGDVQFNVPVEEVNNNLVQTFALDRLVWKKYEAEDLYLTVTFDEDGIYGSLGGDAYGGYAEGGFNFYLNDPGKWDAWVSGTGMAAGPITQALAPENFLMEGPISLKVVSEGRDKKFGVTTGEFQTQGQGWFDIKKFDTIQENFPADWTGLQSSLAEIGLIAVKRFDYDRGSGSLYLEGRDGEFDLRFIGPYGSRELTFHLHDERNTRPALADASADATSEETATADASPVPEASAQPAR